MRFNSREEVKDFIHDRLQPLNTKFGALYKMDLFDYYGSVKDLAAKLMPEIAMQIHPDAKEWDSDEEEFGMIWSSGHLLIEAIPMKCRVFMVIISEH